MKRKPKNLEQSFTNLEPRSALSLTPEEPICVHNWLALYYEDEDKPFIMAEAFGYLKSLVDLIHLVEIREGISPTEFRIDTLTHLNRSDCAKCIGSPQAVNDGQDLSKLLQNRSRNQNP